MFPYRYMLELHGEERSLRTIAAMTRHSRQKVTEVIRLAEKRGLSLPMDDDMTDPWLEDFLYPEKKVEASGRHRMDFDYIHTELAKPHVTLTLLHKEYLRQAQEEGAIPYAYRTFTEHYHNFARKHKATMRIRRKPGELLEVDWAGTTLFVQDPDSGERIPVYVFVASLPCSQLAYVEGSFSMDLPAWIKLHQNAFAYFNGVPHILVPDNLKTGVTKHTSKELVINKTYAEMARHYGTVVMPARVRSPRDKASVESSVGRLYLDHRCSSIDDLLFIRRTQSRDPHKTGGFQPPPIYQKRRIALVSISRRRTIFPPSYARNTILACRMADSESTAGLSHCRERHVSFRSL
ncbi:IS21 family transposase [Alkalicoccus luteus]|uniref:IS21 family transposase n=1 Tax=Alkalicoccus luteus TaxID=1237094 RepID=UPI001FE277C9|nr:IS21 family transposase [Alkalicoccus luteus]